MILNDLEYQVTQERIQGFERALALLNAPDNELKNTNPIMWQLNVDGVQSLIDDFTAQMQEYEALINRNESEPIIFEIGSLAQLPRILIQARIAAKISQKELAQRLGIEESLLQRYEDREYESATLTQLLEISGVLGISLQPKTMVRVVAPLKTA
ncbi:Helix-turn-helix domain protein [Coleofasciculus chthonoplastes PCC 7420]|jgi:HTH-type transcriptional regulator/antitoxin HipB|uniref:Helix-turn-helix domain protein n=1 Tax=Coleofasciculus chthonoplastes PCC 7420 TaxID=118168 RepID=B4W0Z2_9CYAN|nr:helix-turn-helix transcriptional regulator [Coleofasciculus chthonoplastes]EDX72148.1 Helix-turn-helix domain protein [Coleofasciculus chthonoplastes PCC 7420]